MKLYQTKWWKSLFAKPQPHKKYDSVKDIGAVIEFLQEIKNDVKLLIPELKKLENLEQERQVASSGIIHVNINTQVKIMDGILERYGFFQSDTDINGLRLQQVSENLLEYAGKVGMRDLVEKKRGDHRWKFQW
ncbi:MAG TPA: hypothetical protein VJI98_04995 [Candidatus Nanoarchaeia archaeon]|nr:hypothetical protein [Candidatus Nanoarchaeia archaeon]